jgi:hypothetical protein
MKIKKLLMALGYRTDKEEEERKANDFHPGIEI